ncbi:rhodanese-like domain-containing protein [Maricaulis parjimensis]|uniref:rhodanese-like domain-containing protein n=1 Tax=Maricaulis parjimensis TaxID=144023 RepID=UPI0019395936|nr:rhodanese-like domain-containing protein [Maricaulis parjimensis]
MTDLREFEPAEVQAELDAGRCLLIDVREPGEHAREHIAGAILCPLSKLEAGQLPKAKGKSVILHCRSGMRSRSAFQRLREEGLKPAGHMRGGIMAWKSAGLPVEGKGGGGLSLPGLPWILGFFAVIILARLIGNWAS